MNEFVLIVGAGPVGMTLASELARYGVRVRIVDKAAARTDKSKAMVLWSRTLELLDRGGGRGSAPFVEAGFKVAGVAFVADGKDVGRVAMDGIPSAYNYALTIPQSETERLLEERLAGQGVAVERNTEVTAFTMGPGGVDAILRHADGQEEAVRASWLVGCDGAHSAVRHALGAPFSGETLLSDWFLADVHMTGYPRPDTDASIHWHRDGVLILFPIKPGRYRIIGDLPPTDAKVPLSPTLKQVQALVDRRGPAGTTVFDPVWLSGFRINGRKVAEYRHGRVFLAGDAAHVHSPAGGQGMNTGMQDAMNLAWKLALVVRGACRESLLDSYSPERSAVGDQVLEAAGRLTAVATLKNPVAQVLRNLAGHALLGLPRVAHGVADTMSEVAIRYAESPLNGPGLYDMPKPGERVAPATGQRPVGSGSVPLFVLFAEGGSEADALVRRFGGLLDPEVRPPLRAGGICLVRPDGYVAMAASTARSGWAEVVRYLERLAGPTVHDGQAPSTGTHDGSGAIRMGGLEVRFLRSKDETAGSLDVFEMTVRPDGRMPVPHYHESWDETVYGLAGSTTWRIDGRDIAVGPGQTAFIPRGVVHGFRNDTGEAASCLCVLTPGVLGPAYFREMAAVLTGDDAPDPEKMGEIMRRHGLVPALTT